MIYHFESFEFDAERFELRADGEVVHIEPQVAQILGLLISNHGRLVERDEIQYALWTDRVIMPSLIDNRIRAARSAIGDDGRSQRLIKTFPNKGYMFVGQVTETEPTAQGLEPRHRPPVRAAAAKTVAWTAVAAAAVLLLLGVVLSFDFGRGSVAAGKPEISPQELSPNRIAVLNFSTASDQDQNNGISLSRITIAALASLEPLGVVSQRSSLAMDKENETLQHIARLLGAAYVLDGTVSSDDKLMHATVELVAVQEDQVLWAETFEAAKVDESWLEFESRIARHVLVAVANSLGISIEGREQLVLSPEALRSFENGVSLVESEKAYELLEAIALFEDVVEQEPGFILGHMYLAIALERAVTSANMNRALAIERVTKASETVGQLSPDSMELHMTLGILERLNFNSEKGLEYFDRVLEKKPDFLLAHLKKAKTLSDAFLISEALESYQKALSLDPLSNEISLEISQIYFSQGNIDEAMRLVRRALLWDPENLQALEIAAGYEMGVGNYFESKKLLKKALRVNPNDFATQFTAYRLHNNLDLLDELDDILNDPGLLATVAALRGDRQLAYSLARQDKRGWPATYVDYLLGDSEAMYQLLIRVGFSDTYLELNKPVLVDQSMEAVFLLDTFKKQNDPKYEDLKDYMGRSFDMREPQDMKILQEFSGVAAYYSITGQIDKAFEVIDEANRRNLIFVNRLKVSPLFENLRADPGFEARYQTMLDNRDRLLAECAELPEEECCLIQTQNECSEYCE